MVERKEILTRGGVYLAKLNPAKKNEVGKVRPVIIITSQILLDAIPPTVFICPLSSHSYPELANLHVELTPRDSLKVKSYALVEHCRAITIDRLVYPRIAELIPEEMELIIHRLRLMIE